MFETNKSLASLTLGFASLSFVPACSDNGRASLDDVSVNAIYTEKDYIPFKQILGDPKKYSGANTILPGETTHGIRTRSTRLNYLGTHTIDSDNSQVFNYEFTVNVGTLYEQTYILISDKEESTAKDMSVILRTTENGKFYFDARKGITGN